MIGNALITQEELCTRYAMFAKQQTDKIKPRTIYAWRKERGFPNPTISRPKCYWKKTDVQAWEKAQGYDEFLPSLQQQTT